MEINNISSNFNFYYSDIKNNKFPQSVIIDLDCDSGGHLLTLYLAKAILCYNLSDTGVCNNCISCNLFEESSHPDFFKIEPDISSNTKNIKIESVRTVIEGVRFTSKYKKGQVIVCNNVENLTLQAQNSILKILEEPKSNLFFILQTKSYLTLLPTIKSRCQVLSLANIFDYSDQKEIKDNDFKMKWNKLLSLLYSEKSIFVSNNDKNKLLYDLYLLIINDWFLGSVPCIEFSEKLSSFSLDMVLDCFLFFVYSVYSVKTGISNGVNIYYCFQDCFNLPHNYSDKHSILELQSYYNILLDENKKLSWKVVSSGSYQLDLLLLKLGRLRTTFS